MRVVEINTTAYNDENLFIITDLTDNQIISVLHPIIEAERDGGEEYDNDMLILALEKAYPSKTIIAEEPHYLSI